MFLMLGVLLLSCSFDIQATPNSHSEDNQEISMFKSRWKIKRWAAKNNYNYVIIKSYDDILQNARSRTIYEIRCSVDLKGGKLQIPSDCYFKFHNGAIINGEVLGDLKNDFISVASFGAVQNDGNDDSRAIQNALNVCSSRIVFDEGNYDVSKALYIRNSGVSLEGNGSVLTVKPSESLRVAINAFSVSNVSIADFSIVSTNSYPSSSAFPREQGSSWSNVLGIVASGVDSITINNVKFANLEYAIKIDGREGKNSNIVISNVQTNDAIAMPIYISYSSDVKFESCNISASVNASKFDHHIYGCSDNINHEIINCKFSGGSGVPIHYYTDDSTSNKDIVIRKCFLTETLGGVLISSKSRGSMVVHELVYRSSRPYSLVGVFHADGDNSLSVYNSEVFAPDQYLFSCASSSSILDSISAEVRSLQCALPRHGGKMIFQNCDITLKGQQPLAYVSESNSVKLGEIQFVNNLFKINEPLEYLFSTRGTSPEEFRVVGNTFKCNGNVKYIVYNAGASNPNFVFEDNLIYGCPSARHSSVKDGIFKNNIIK